MKGNITISKDSLEIFIKICEDRFNGTYKIKETHDLGYIIEIEFSDIQDVFSLGRIFEGDFKEQ